MSLNTLNQSGLSSSNPALFQTIKELIDAQDAIQKQANAILPGIPFSTGNWTPIFSFVAPGDLVVNYQARQGHYTRIGNKVFLTWLLVITPTFTTSAGGLVISGIPFPHTAALNNYGFGCLVFNNITAAGYTDFTVQIQTGAQVINIVAGAQANIPVLITAPNIISGTVSSNYSGMIWYDTEDNA